MEEIFNILQQHLLRYPAMQPCDLVKLLYQREFGSGHLISESNVSLERIMRELDLLPWNLPDMPLIERIGNGYARVHLQAVRRENISPEKLNEIFIRSTAACAGSVSHFDKTLDAVSERLAELSVPFSESDFFEYLIRYRQAGYPLVSHSEIYRHAYSPAYRVCLLSLWNSQCKE